MWTFEIDKEDAEQMLVYISEEFDEKTHPELWILFDTVDSVDFDEEGWTIFTLPDDIGEGLAHLLHELDNIDLADILAASLDWVD